MSKTMPGTQLITVITIMLKLISKTAENREDIKVMCALQRNNHVTEKKHLAIMSH